MKYFSVIHTLIISIILLSILIATLLFFNQPEPRKYCGGSIDPPFAQPTYTSVHIEGEILFKENCKSCHKIHQDAVGPALAGVTDRRSRKWLYVFIKNSSRMIRKGDTAAVNVYEKYGRAEMPIFSNLTNAEIDSMLIYIDFYEEKYYYQPQVISCP